MEVFDKIIDQLVEGNKPLTAEEGAFLKAQFSVLSEQIRLLTIEVEKLKRKAQDWTVITVANHLPAMGLQKERAEQHLFVKKEKIKLFVKKEKIKPELKRATKGKLFRVSKIRINK
jgi:hypothetical protein